MVNKPTQKPIIVKNDRIEDSLTGTVFERMSLEQLLANVDDNEIWRTEDKNNIDIIKQNITNDYNRFILVRQSKESSFKLSQQLHISDDTINSWRSGKIPASCKNYINSYLPKTDKERIEYAYLLGVCSTQVGPERGKAPKMIRRIKDKIARDKFCKTLKKFSKRKISIIDDVVRYHDVQFNSVLYGVRRNYLLDYVDSSQERNAFIEGYFGAMRNDFRIVKNSPVIIIYSIIPQIIKVLSLALFEKEVYCYVSPNEDRLIIVTLPNMSALSQSKILSRAAQISLDDHLLSSGDKNSLSVRQYYELRAETVLLLNKSKEGLVPKLQLKYHYGIPTIRRWISDLVEINGEQNKPHIVSLYETMCDYHALPNKYTILNPVCINGDWFLPVDGFIYRFPINVQNKYLREYGKDSFELEDANHLWDKLKKTIKQSRDGDLIINYNPEERIITDVSLSKKLLQ